MAMKAKIIPIQFFLDMFSLNKTKPTNVESAKMAILLMVNIVELSVFSTRNAKSRKYIEP
jgi:hypothetical protein